MVDSTALVQLNETLAHQRIQETFRRFSETITHHEGTPHELRGDALVAEFSTASDAVTASVDFQNANNTHNETLPADIHPVVRIGIAMGEVVIADQTVTGEGVVLAQRLEQMAEPGGICIHDAVYQIIPKRLAFEYESLGEREVKGFDEPVRAYTVRQKQHTDTQTRRSRATSDLPDKPSIAVLPFTNMSGDPEQEYFSDGITEDIITDLSRFRMISVASRNSSFSYKQPRSRIQHLAAELRVHYVLEGSVRKAGNRVRVSAQLIDGVTESHVWAERYDRSFDDIFEVQDELTRTIVATISRRIETHSLERAQRRPPDNMDAYAHVLRGRERINRRDRESSMQARECFEKALDLDPSYGMAWAELAGVYMYEWNGAWTSSPEESLRKSLQYAHKAFTLDPNDPLIILRLGFNQFFAGELEPALQLFKRALELNPNDSEALCRVGLVLTFLGRHAEAIDHLEHALALDPLGNSVTEWYLGIAYFSDRRYAEAIETLKSCRAGVAEVQAWLAAAYAQGGMSEEALNQGVKYIAAAQEEMRENQARLPESWCAFLSARGPFTQNADMEHFIHGLHKAGLE